MNKTNLILDRKDEFDMLLAARNYKKLRFELEQYPCADIAEYFSLSAITSILPVFRLLPKELAAEVFSYFEPETQSDFVSSITDEEITQIIDELSVDDAVDMLEEMPASLVRRILKNVSVSSRKELNTFLKYPDECVGSIMTSEYTSLHSSMTVDEAIRYIRNVSDEKETIYTCYVTGARRELEGVLELSDILRCKDDSILIEEIMYREVVSVTTSDNKEGAANLFDKYDLYALPVTDSENRLVGIVTVDDIVDVIREEATKDIEQMAGIGYVETPYLKTSTFSLVKARIPWLLVLMLAGMLNGAIMGSYEAAISAIPLLVTFTPMLTGTGGNSGTQAATTVIRALTTGEIELRDFFKVFLKELKVAIFVGFIFAAVNFGRIILFSNDPDKTMIALVVSIAMLVTVLLAKSLGALLPLAAQKMHLDPAVVASPMITTVVDAISLLVYFQLANVLLSGRL